MTLQDSEGGYSVTDSDGPNQYEPVQISTNNTSIRGSGQKTDEIGLKIPKMRKTWKSSTGPNGLREGPNGFPQKPNAERP